MKRHFFHALLMLILAIAFTPLSAFAQTVGDLPAQPVYGANPEKALFTVVTYTADKDRKKPTEIVATITANEDLTKFELLCNYFQDQKVLLSVSDGAVVATDYTKEVVARFAPEIVEEALEQDIWLPVSECPIAYEDPAPEVGGEPCIVAGVYEGVFERNNPNLNDLPHSVFDKTVASYKEACEQGGSVVPFEYDTYLYAKDAINGDALSHETPVTKIAYIYLPYGYNDSKQYDILYLLHGAGGTASSWFSQNDGGTAPVGEGAAVHILDNLIANGDVPPCIVVTPGLYDAEGAEEIPQTSYTFTDNFAYELRDLVSAVEEEYSTYAENTTPEGLTASRDHRAMVGLSMGSITTWRSGIAQCLDLFSWYGNMSAGPATDEQEAVDTLNNTIIPAIEAAQEKGYSIHMMLSFDGTQDMALAPHVAAHHALLSFMETSDVLVVGENYDFITSNGGHFWDAWNLYLYDLMHVFFR